MPPLLALNNLSLGKEADLFTLVFDGARVPCLISTQLFVEQESMNDDRRCTCMHNCASYLCVNTEHRRSADTADDTKA